MYHRIGTKRKQHNTYGSKFIDNLVKDLKISFPEIEGLSARNLRYMQKFADE